MEEEVGSGGYWRGKRCSNGWPQRIETVLFMQVAWLSSFSFAWWWWPVLGFMITSWPVFRVLMSDGFAWLSRHLLFFALRLCIALAVVVERDFSHSSSFSLSLSLFLYPPFSFFLNCIVCRWMKTSIDDGGDGGEMLVPSIARLLLFHHNLLLLPRRRRRSNASIFQQWRCRVANENVDACVLLHTHRVRSSLSHCFLWLFLYRYERWRWRLRLVKWTGCGSEWKSREPCLETILT